MKESTLSKIRDALLYVGRNLIIVCGAAVVLAFVVAYWGHVTKGSPLLPTALSTLGILGIALMIIGAVGVASSPAHTLSRGEVSRTHVQDMRSMRSAPNPWIGVGISVFLSGVIVSYVAYVLA